MFRKIKKAAFEGTLIGKGLAFIFVKIPKRLLQKLDWLLGCVVRSIYTGFKKTDPKQIMFIPFQGDYTCNPKYIANELLRRGEPCRIVFAARARSINERTGYPECVQLVEQYTDMYYQELAKSKVIVANSVEFLKKPTPKKRDQVLIETWHGSLGIKKFGEKNNSGKSWVAAAKRCGKLADYVISNSTFEDAVYRDTFWKKTEILQYGHPRNDILLKQDEELAKSIRRNVLHECEDWETCHLVLYAPTFRDNHTLECYDIDFERLTVALAERFGGTWQVLLRLHPTVRKASGKLARNRPVLDVTKYPDIQELMLIADAAITDYSSWIYDFILTRKPGFIFATDIASYVDERGFYYPLTSTPFSISVNNDELMENVRTFDDVHYRQEVEAFLQDKGCMDDGFASQRTVDKILEVMGE